MGIVQGEEQISADMGAISNRKLPKMKDDIATYTYLSNDILTQMFQSVIVEPSSRKLGDSNRNH